MNIKSEIDKPIIFFKSITLGMVLMSILLATILSLLIIVVGEGVWFKLLFLLIAGLIGSLNAFDNSKVYDTVDEKNKAAKRNGLIILMTLLFIEIPLFINSSATRTIPLAVVVSDNETSKTDDDGKVHVTKYKKVDIINLENNDRVGYRKFSKNEEHKIKYWKNITGKQYYISYMPFFIYDEKFKYIRDNNDSK